MCDMAPPRIERAESRGARDAGAPKTASEAGPDTYAVSTLSFDAFRAGIHVNLQLALLFALKLKDLLTHRLVSAS